MGRPARQQAEPAATGAAADEPQRAPPTAQTNRPRAGEGRQNFDRLHCDVYCRCVHHVLCSLFCVEFKKKSIYRQTGRVYTFLCYFKKRQRHFFVSQKTQGISVIGLY